MTTKDSPMLVSYIEINSWYIFPDWFWARVLALYPYLFLKFWYHHILSHLFLMLALFIEGKILSLGRSFQPIVFISSLSIEGCFVSEQLQCTVCNYGGILESQTLRKLCDLTVTGKEKMLLWKFNVFKARNILASN